MCCAASSKRRRSAGRLKTLVYPRLQQKHLLDVELLSQDFHNIIAKGHGRDGGPGRGPPADRRVDPDRLRQTIRGFAFPLFLPGNSVILRQ